MAGKKTGKRLLTWVLVLVMALSLLPLNALAAGGPETDGGSGMNFDKRLVDDEPDGEGNYTIRMTAQATGTTTTKVEPMDIVLVLDQSGSMADDFSNGTRQSAMIAAVNSFIGEVADKYSTDADHRMAIVTFGYDADMLVGWTAVDPAGATELTRSISNLPPKPEGATNVGAGMQMAKNLMNDAYTGNNTDRQKTVIVFTDGVPTTKQEFNTTVANNAISAAKDMKDNGVTIYTVGIFKGANTEQLYGDSGFDKNSNGMVGSNWSDFSFWMIGDVKNYDVPAGNRFLNYLSSNFESAAIIGLKAYQKTFAGIGYHGWEITQNFNRTSSDYYLTAADASSLEKIFEGISSTVPAPVNSKLDKNTVITDTLSNYFTFAGTEEDVKVYAIDANGTEKESEDAAKATATPNGKTVTVTGYDFSKHYQGIGGDAEEELVIEIKVKPSGDGCTSKEIPTNDDDDRIHAARVEVEVESEGETETKIVTSHETAKVTGYKVIYDLDGGTGDMTGNGLYYPQAADVPVTDSVPTHDGHEFIGWKSDIDGDNKVYTSDGTNNSFTMPAANVTLTAQWREIEAAEPTPATVTLSDANGNALIKKHLTVNGDGLAEGTYFVAKLEAVNDLAKGVLSGSRSCKTGYMIATGNDVFTFDNTDDGNILTFSAPGEYTFKVTEENLSVKYMQYDDTEYTMTVNVTPNDGNTALVAAVSFKNGENAVNDGYITFNNTYKTSVYDFNLNDPDTIKVNKEFKSKYDRSSPTMRFEATATIEKQETYIIVNPGIDNNVTNNGSAVPTKPDYTKVGEATGTVTLKAGKTEAFDFGKNSTFQPCA